jgi:alginate O-acetyltransferase complex protein AlgI
MLFNSFIYLGVFLPITALVYFAIGVRQYHRLSIAWLVAASLLYYGWWNPAYLGLIIGSSLFNFSAGMMLGNDRDYSAAIRLWILRIAITANILLLCYFKYANFFVDNINWALGSEFSIDKIILPLAISFVTFQKIAYLVDAYRGETKDYNFLHFLLFVTFFPQLIAGPIVHHFEMMPQFDKDETYKPRWRNLEVGVTILVIGLFKKVVIADGIAAYARPVFLAAEAGEALSIGEAWLGATAFALQLYFDFSGYTDMAIGSARIFGIKLPINFYSPFKSLNISDFWRRWHMTLTRFITAYIYTPLSIKMARLCAAHDWGLQPQFWLSSAYPLMITFLLAGFWHGVGWNFLIFGFLQGAFLIGNAAWREYRKRILGHRLKDSSFFGRLTSRFLTIAAFIWSLVFFNAKTTHGAMTLSAAMFGANGWSWSIGAEPLAKMVGLQIILFAIIFLLPNTQQFMIDYEPSLEPVRTERMSILERIRWRPSRNWALFVGGLFAFALLQMNRISEFIYYQF